MKSTEWKRFQETLARYGVTNFKRNIETRRSLTGTSITIEFWIPSPKFYEKCTHVFFTAFHPNKSFCTHRKTRKSYYVSAYVDAKKCTLRDAYWNLKFQTGNY